MSGMAAHAEEQDCDVAIVGGGMVGATLATALLGGGMRVALIEARDIDTTWHPENYTGRVSAITHASMRILRSVGAWDEIAARRVSPYREMHVWDATGSGVIHFDSADIGEPLLGHIIENQVIESALHERLAALTEKHPGALQLMCPARISGLRFGTSRARLVLDDGRVLNARLVVGADGSRSSVRELAGLTARGWSYRQQAVVATIKTERHHRETAWQRFMPDGPLAFLPLADGRSSIVWSTGPEQASELLELCETDFLIALHKAFGDNLGAMLAAGPRSGFPLRMLHAPNYVKPRIALAGDAAHSIHPLAGQGVNLGLADAATLAEVLVQAHGAGEDIGAMKVLRRYERWRKGDNLGMIAGMEGFKRLFGSRNPLARLLRNTGLTLTDSMTPLKNLLVRHAMGLPADHDGDLPRLARGLPIL